MRRSIVATMILTLVLASNTALLGQNALQWKEVASLPNFGRSEAAHLVLNGKLYIGCGVLYDGTYKNDFWEYDPSTNQWAKKANYPGGGKFGVTFFAINNKAYVGLGYDGSKAYKDFYQYDPVTDSWTRIADFPGTARYHATAMVISDTGFVGTGMDGVGVATFKDDFYMYLPSTDNWVKRANFPGGKAVSVVTFTLNGYGYAGNMSRASGLESFPDNQFWRYDKNSDSWDPIATMPGPTRRLTSSFTYKNKAYVGCGTSSGGPITNYLNDFYEYNPASNSWTRYTVNSDFTGRVSCHTFSIGDSIIYAVAGAYKDGVLTDCWKLRAGNDSCIAYDTMYKEIYIAVEDTLKIYLTNKGNCDSVTLSLYPNPTSEWLHLSSADYACIENREVFLIDHLGRILETRTITSPVTSFNMKRYSSAMYFLKCVDEDGEILFVRKIEFFW